MSMSIDSEFRAKFGHRMLYSNVDANVKDMLEVSVVDLDVTDFAESADWMLWLNQQFIAARDSDLGLLCNCK
jgi:hypothetical protein